MHMRQPCPGASGNARWNAAERRVASSEKMLQEIHTMVLALYQALAAGSAPAALGSAKQVTDGCVQVLRRGDTLFRCSQS